MQPLLRAGAGPIGQQVAPAPAGPRPWPPPLPLLVSCRALRSLNRPRAGVLRPQAPAAAGSHSWTDVSLGCPAQLDGETGVGERRWGEKPGGGGAVHGPWSGDKAG